MPTIAKEINIESFRAGKHISASGESYEFSLDDLQQMVSSYNPSDNPAPAVVGHPKTDSPAYGWIKSVKLHGDKLITTVGDMVQDFADWLDNKHFRKVSLSLYKPDSPNNPTPGMWSIKHLGFLGGVPPAVKGLSPVSFNEMKGVISFDDSGGLEPEFYVIDIFRKIREYFIANGGLEVAEGIVPNDCLNGLAIAMKNDESDEENFRNYTNSIFSNVQSQIMDLSDRVTALEDEENDEENEGMDMTEEQTNDNQIEFAELRSELSKQKKILDDLVAITQAEREQLAKERAAIEEEKVFNFVEGLIKNLQLPPTEKDVTVKLILATPNNTEIEFSEGVTRTPRQQLMESLKARTPLVETREIATPDNDVVDYAQVSDDLKLPPGYAFDPESLKIYNRAKEYQKNHPEMDFSEALTVVVKGGK